MCTLIWYKFCYCQKIPIHKQKHFLGIFITVYFQFMLSSYISWIKPNMKQCLEIQKPALTLTSISVKLWVLPISQKRSVHNKELHFVWRSLWAPKSTLHRTNRTQNNYSWWIFYGNWAKHLPSNGSKVSLKGSRLSEVLNPPRAKRWWLNEGFRWQKYPVCYITVVNELMLLSHLKAN